MNGGPGARTSYRASLHLGLADGILDCSGQSGTGSADLVHAATIRSRSMEAPAANLSAVNWRDSAVPVPSKPWALSSW